MDLYVTGHPRSGNTWLCRLLSDILRAELVSGYNAAGVADVQYWGEGSPDDNFRVFKTHSAELMPGTTVFIYRDPRDVMTSTWHYQNIKYQSLAEVIIRMGDDEYNPLSDRYGKYENVVRFWWNTGRAQAQVRYEDLHFDPVKYMDRVIYYLTGRRWSTQAINNGIFRQEFSRIKAQYSPQMDHSMWVGQIGNWRNYYTRKEADLTQALFGDLMLEQGYIETPDWVHEFKL